MKKKEQTTYRLRAGETIFLNGAGNTLIQVSMITNPVPETIITVNADPRVTKPVPR